MVWPTLLKAPEYLAKTGYANPSNPVDGPWQYATDSVGMVSQGVSYDSTWSFFGFKVGSLSECFAC